MAEGSQAMTSFYAKRIIGDSANSLVPNDGLLQVNVSDTKLVTRSHNNNSAYYIAYVDDTTAGIDIIEFQNINLELTNTAGDTLTFSTSTIESSGDLSVNITSTSAVVFGGNIHTNGAITIGNLQGLNLILDNHSIFAREWDSTNEEYIDSALSLGGDTSIDGYLNVVGDFYSGGDIYLAEAKSIFMNYTVPGEEGEEGTSTDFPILVNNDDGTVSLNSLTGALYLGYLNTEEIHIYTSDSIDRYDWIEINADGPYATTNLGVGGQDPDYVFYVNGTSYLNGNLTIKGDGIYYAGTQNTYRMIRFIDNTGDVYGNGISIGGGGLTVIGSGESADTLISNLSLTYGGTETTYIASDGNIEFYPGQNSYSAAARIWMTAGVLNIGVDGNTTRENSLNIYSGAGRLQLYSAASTTGNRGLWVGAHGSGNSKNIVLIDTNNIAKFVGSFGDDVSYTIRYINSTDTTTWTADTLGATTSFAIIRGSVTGAHTTGHIFFLNVNDVGTPFQLAIHDSSELYFYKRYKSSGSWTAWTKMNAGYADTAGSSASCTGNAASASRLDTNTSTTSSDPGGLTWFNVSGRQSATVNTNDTPSSGSDVWWYINRNRHTNTGNNYYTDVAIPFNANTIYYKRINNNTIVNNTTNNGWIAVLDQLNYTTWTVTKTGSGASGSWGISVTGSSASCTGNAATASALNNGATAGPQIKLPSGQTTFSMLTSGNGAAYVNYGKLGLADAYANIDISTYRFDCYGGHARIHTGCLHIFPASMAGQSYNEGLRIHCSSGNWATIMLCGTDNTGNSGTSTNSWGIFNNNGTLYINKATSSGAGNPRAYANANGWYFGKAYGAVWNDFAEYRQANINTPGRVVIPSNDGIARISTERLQAGGRVISDTFGFAVGESDRARTPLGLSGRVLAYPYQNKENYKIGDAVCTAPNGTVDIMTREEIKEYPDRIIGIVNEIPDYDVWEESLECPGGEPTTTKIKINGRIWIDIK